MVLICWQQATRLVIYYNTIISHGCSMLDSKLFWLSLHEDEHSLCCQLWIRGPHRFLEGQNVIFWWPNYSWLMFIQTMSFFLRWQVWQAENEELIQRFRLAMGSSSGFQSLLAMLAEHSLWGTLRSLKCRAIFVSLWKLIEEKEWSAVLASLNHFDHRTDILDRSWLICLLFMSPWLNDVPIWLLDIPVFAHFKVKSCVCIPMIAFFSPMFLFTCFDASNCDGGPVLICWPGCIDLLWG